MTRRKLEMYNFRLSRVFALYKNKTRRYIKLVTFYCLVFNYICGPNSCYQGGSFKNNTFKLNKDKKEDTVISAPTTRNKLFDKSWTIMVKRSSIPASEYKLT